MRKLHTCNHRELRLHTDRLQDTMHAKILLLILSAICINAQESPKLCLTYGCFKSTDTQVCMTLDGDDIFYADFTKSELVWDARIPLSVHMSQAYEYAVYYRSLCKCNLLEWSQDESISSVNREPPEIVVYPRDKVLKEQENTLLCFINRFFPPIINITWTKNNEELTMEEPFKKCLPNPDGTFHVLSSLDFIPQEGDIYSCTVEHEALEAPQTKFWEVALNAETTNTSMGPTIYFGFASTFGLLAGAMGIFFFAKGRQC